MNAPSRTSQAVALTRASLDRPHSADGDPDAQRALCADMEFAPPSWLRPSVQARTQFIDDQVIAAVADGVRQVVICGAGYDDRALRFRTEAVRFFELDHPGTQADKARRLQAIASGAAGPVLVPIDFRSQDAGGELAASGHDGSQRSLFICEGLLVYLDLASCRRLLAALAGCAAPGSALVATLATHADGLDSAAVIASANARRRTGDAEPWQTIMPAGRHLELLADAGWAVCATEVLPVPADGTSDGRRSLLVAAVPAGAIG